jgi:hypothetical protein
LVVVWDNAYSYWREKRVAFCSRVKKCGEPGTATGPARPPPKVNALPPPPTAKSDETGAASPAEPAVAPVVAVPISRESVMARLEAAKAAKAAKSQAEASPPAESTAAEAPPAAAAVAAAAAAVAAAVSAAAASADAAVAMEAPVAESAGAEAAAAESAPDLMELPEDGA